MAIAVYIDLPSVTAAQYDQLFDAVGRPLVAAPGFLAHAATPQDDAVHIVELWRSEEEYGRFVEERIAPLAKGAGITPHIRVEKLAKLVTPPHAGALREGTSTSDAKPLGKDDGEAFRVGPIEILVKEDGSASRQTFAVAEFRGKGFRIPPHVHTEHDESIYVLEGTLGVRLGDRTFEAPAGTSFTIPIDVVHSVWNESEAPVRFLNTIVPARYLDYFHELALVAKEQKLAPKEEMMKVMGRYGLRLTA